MEGKEAEKKDKLLEALDRGMVMVHLDARRAGVLVPTSLKQEAHLRLNLSYRFDPPDLSVSEWGCRSTLTFNGEKFMVGIPWSALFAITSYVTREFWLYPEDMPKELVEMSMATEKANLAAELPKTPERVVLREVALPPEAAVAPPPTDEPPAPRPRPALRLVK